MIPMDTEAEKKSLWVKTNKTNYKRREKQLCVDKETFIMLKREFGNTKIV